MRLKPATPLLLLALSSFAFAQLRGLNSGGSGISGSIPSAFSCFTSLSGALPAIMVLMVGGGMVLKKKNDGGGMMSALGPIMGLMILIQAAMNGALCKSNAVMFIAVFSILETIMASDTGSKNPMMGILNMILILPIFQYILSSPSLMNNPTSLMGVLIIPLLLSGAMDAGSGSISFSGFGGSVWNGLKSLKNSIKGIPEGNELENEAEKELTKSLAKINDYILKLEKEAEKRISAERKRARTEAKKQKKALHLEHDKYGKIETKLLEDATELGELSYDLLHDRQLIAEDLNEINNFEETVKTEVRETLNLVVSFIQQHHESAADQFTKHGFGNSDTNAEMATLENIEKGCDKAFNATLNGAVRFAKLSALLETTDKIFKTAERYLKETDKNEQREWKIESKETTKDAHGLGI